MYQVTLATSYFPAQTDDVVEETTIGAALRAQTERTPNAGALVEAGMAGDLLRRWTYTELLEDSERVARALLARYRPGERVCGWAPNIPGKWKLIAVADVDLNRAANIKKRFPDVKIYQVWRVLLDKERKNFDSANVSTPDHMHAPIAMSAMQLGKHIYCQKPLAHDLFEVRRLTEMAARKKLATQMGIQIHSAAEYRLAVKLVQDGVIGKIKQVHTWSNKKWGDLDPLPSRGDPIPDGFNWDLWLGVCATRAFIGDAYYHAGNWRKRLDFGCGNFGDMGCHIYDPVFKAVDLTAPVSLRSERPTARTNGTGRPTLSSTTSSRARDSLRASPSQSPGMTATGARLKRRRR